MKTKKAYFIIFSFLMWITFNIQPSFAEISADSYCHLTIKMIRQQIFNLQELIELANQYPDDPKTLENRQAGKKAEFEQVNNAFFTTFGITDKEYVTYMGRNAQSVNIYLKANPDIRQQIDELAAQRNELLEQYESFNRR